MSVLLLIACTAGELHLDGEDVQLRSSWVFQDTDKGHTGILLSNNHLPCQLSGEDDPTEVVLDTQALNHAYTREGSVLLWIELNQEEVTPRTTFDVSAYYHRVHEAELMWEKGLTSAYRATETETLQFDGKLSLNHITERQWNGHIELGSNTIIGNFKAQLCDSKDLSQILGLYGIN